jgi:uncharacterized protein (TIGR02246 family)
LADDPRSPIVAALLEAFADAWNRHDAKAIVGTFAPDADLYNLRGKKLTGRDDIGKFFTRALGATMASSQVASPEPSVRFVGESAAAVDLFGHISGIKDPKGQARPDRRFLLDGTAALNPNGGWWLVVAHLKLLPLETDAKPGGDAAAPDDST